MTAMKLYNKYKAKVKIPAGLKKKTALCSLPIVLLLAVLLSVSLMQTGKREKKQAMQGETSTLVIDPGHGGIDGGALAQDGTRESDINLAIALRLRAIAELCGKDNTLLRSDDSTKCDTPEYSERRDLEKRTELVNKTANPIYIGIHQNCYPTGQPSGAQVIYSDFSGSELLAKITLSNLISTLDPTNRRVAEPLTRKLYILSNANCPAILVECGFMSNFSDIQKLKSTEYQTALAVNLMASYIQYIDNTVCI